MSEEELTKVKAQLKNELERSFQGKVNLIGVMAGILGLILASVGGFLAFESFALSQVSEVREKVLNETAARRQLHEETFKLSKQTGRMFEDVSEAEDFATMQYRLKTYLTRVDPISVP